MSLDLYFYQHCNNDEANEAYTLLMAFINLSNVPSKERKKPNLKLKIVKTQQQQVLLWV